MQQEAVSAAIPEVVALHPSQAVESPTVVLIVAVRHRHRRREDAVSDLVGVGHRLPPLRIVRLVTRLLTLVANSSRPPRTRESPSQGTPACPVSGATTCQGNSPPVSLLGLPLVLGKGLPLA